MFNDGEIDHNATIMRARREFKAIETRSDLSSLQLTVEGSNISSL